LAFEPWKIDVLIAALGSIAINGLACGLMIFGAHGPRDKPVLAKVIDITPYPVAISVPAVRTLNAKSVITLLRDCVPEAKGERASWADNWPNIVAVDHLVAIPTIRRTNSGGCSASFVKRSEFRPRLMAITSTASIAA
jgi:hypothetical protein